MHQKIIGILPYIGLKEFICLDSLEIIPLENISSMDELSEHEKEIILLYGKSFLPGLFNVNKIKTYRGIGIIKFNGSFILKPENTEEIDEHLKLLHFYISILKNIDPFNYGYSFIDVRCYELFLVDCKNEKYQSKFSSLHNIEELYSSIPSNVNGLTYIHVLPIENSLQSFNETSFICKSINYVLGLESNYFDKINISHLHTRIKSIPNFYDKIKRIAKVFFILSQQNLRPGYLSFIPTLLEVIFDVEQATTGKKEFIIKKGKRLDEILVNDNFYCTTKWHGKKPEENLGLIARLFNNIYDGRNEFLHSGGFNQELFNITYKDNVFFLELVFEIVFRGIIFNLLKDNDIISKESEIDISQMLSKFGEKTTIDKTIEMGQ